MIPWWWTIVCIWIGSVAGLVFRGLFEVSATADRNTNKKGE